MTTGNEIKLEKDLCRCCHAEGNFSSLNEVYNNENLCDVIKNCFDMNIAPVSGKHSTLTYAICPECIRKLKDAYLFKNQVQKCEKRFYDLYYRNNLFEDTSFSKPIVKLEPDPQKELQKKCELNVISDNGITSADYKTDIRNAVKLIIMFSNATPFRWSYSKYMCFFCDKAFQRFSELKQHQYEHEANIEVPLISVKAESKVKFEITDLICTMCVKQMQTIDDLLDHITISHDKGHNSAVRCSIFAFKITDSDVPCPQCSESFTFFGTLLSHVYRTHASAGQFLCDTCGKGFLTKLTLKKHVKAEHLVTDYVCRKCNVSFKTYGAFSYHRIVHKGVFNCPQCSETFPSWYLRKRHLAFVHDKSLQIACEFCSKTFIKYNSLKWHLMSVHRNEKPFSCELCDFKCINRTYLNRHMVCHSNIRPFQCHICVKAFQRKEHLESHVRIHMNDKRYVCKDCGKGFVQVAGLRVHARAHHSKDA